MKLRGACIQTHNIEEMTAFYQRIFGCEPEIDGGVDFRFPDQQLIVFKLAEENVPSTKNVALIYQVDDADLEYARLTKSGIESDPPTDKPWGVRSFVINDPEGNIVSFIQNL